MIRQDQLATVVDNQHNIFLKKKDEATRDAQDTVPVLESFATIITGIRRCGKSTLVLQLIDQKYPDAFFLNFEDIMLAGFEKDDFIRLHNEIVQRGVKVLCFDEIQLIANWEIFVHQLLREGYQVFVTGSNASLMSREMGTHLTGRYLSIELFPFSYKEFISFTKAEANTKSLEDYMNCGGMPEYVKSREGQILSRLLEDIIIRDISVRQSVRDVNILRQLTVYLLSNVGNLITASKLTGMYGVKSPSTFLEYFNFLSDAYLLEFMPQFSYSLKVQARNPRKVYAIDTGFVSVVGMLFTENNGQRFENLIYLHLRRKTKELYYYKDKWECDFVVMKNGQLLELVQVCYKIDDMNFNREYNGLLEAMQYFKAKNGTIVTFDQTDQFTKDGCNVMVVPAHEYFLLK